VFQQITRVGKHSVVYGLGQLLQRLGSFFLIPIYTTHFTAADYGMQEVLTNTSSLLTILLGLGMVSGLYRSYFMYPDEESRLNVIKTALVAFAVSSTVAGGLLLLAVRPLSRLLLPDPSHWPLMALTICFIMLGNIIAIPFAVLRARGLSTRFVLFSLAQFLVNVGATIILVVSARRGVRGSLEGNLLGQVAVLILFLPLLLAALKARFSRHDLKEMLTFGLPLVPALLASTSLMVSDRYFLRAFSTFDEIGVYGLGYKVGLVVQLLVVTPFTLSWGPVMWAVATKTYARQFYAKVMTYFSTVALYVALAVSVLSPEIVRLLSRREAYWRAWQVVPFVALSYVLYGLYFQGAVGINLKKETRFLPFVVGSAAAVNLVLNYLLIRPWGIMGAAASTVISYLLLVVLVFWVSQRLYPIAYEWGRLFRLALVAALIYLASLLVPNSPTWLAVLLKLFLLLLFPLVLLAIRFFAPEELARGRQLVSTGWQKLAAGLGRVVGFLLTRRG